MSRKYRIRFYIYMAIICPIGFLIGCMFSSDVINSSYNGFALDDKNLLYVGKHRRIDVYENGEYVRTVFKNDGKSYAFTIQDEKIYIATYDTIDMVLVIDLSGNLLETIDDSEENERRKLERQKNEFLNDEATYSATNIMGFYKIIKFSDGKREVIYHKPIIDYFCGIVEIAIYISIPVYLLTNIPPMIREYDESKKHE